VRRERRGSFFSLFSFFFFIFSFNSPTGSKGRYSVPLATTLVIASTGEIHQTCISGFFNQGENKIPTSDIVRETAEERVAERILAEFLDNCAAHRHTRGPAAVAQASRWGNSSRVLGLVEREERLDSCVYCQQDQADETDYQPDSNIG
jgi:hypothetical protein